MDKLTNLANYYLDNMEKLSVKELNEGVSLDEFGSIGDQEDARIILDACIRIAKRKNQANWAPDNLPLDDIAEYLRSHGPVHYWDIEREFKLDRGKVRAALIALAYRSVVNTDQFPGPISINVANGVTGA